MYGRHGQLTVTQVAIALRDGQSPGIQQTLTIIGLIADRANQARLTWALRGFARLRLARSVAECRLLIEQDLSSVAALIVEPQDSKGIPTAALVAQLSAALPTIPIIAYCDASVRCGGDAVALVRAGVREIVLRGIDDGALALRDAVIAASHATAADRVMTALRDIVHPRVWPLLEHCLMFGRRPLTVGDVADALGVHRKTLVNRCAVSNLPSPVIVVGWCRLFLVAALLEQKAYTIEHIAEELEYSSSTALRNMIRRYLGVTATEVRALGGLAFVLERFARRVAPITSEEKRPLPVSDDRQLGRWRHEHRHRQAAK